MKFSPDDVNADLNPAGAPEDGAAEPRYGAPALEKGLDLLEALADEADGLTQRELACRVGRTVGEIFRMLGVLERRGYVARDAKSGEYRLTLKLFGLAHRHQPTRRIQLAALPVMQELAEEIGQSCHMVIRSGERILVVAQVESRDPMGFAVRLGADFPFEPRFVSARILAAFETAERRAELVVMMTAPEGATSAKALTARLERIRRDGFDRSPSETTAGVLDLAFPVFDHMEQARASLVVPFLPYRGRTPEAAVVLARLGKAARRISLAIGAPTSLP